jgi:hypothetical protein
MPWHARSLSLTHLVRYDAVRTAMYAATKHSLTDHTLSSSLLLLLLLYFSAPIALTEPALSQRDARV